MTKNDLFSPDGQAQLKTSLQEKLPQQLLILCSFILKPLY